MCRLLFAVIFIALAKARAPVFLVGDFHDQYLCSGRTRDIPASHGVFTRRPLHSCRCRNQKWPSTCRFASQPDRGGTSCVENGAARKAELNLATALGEEGVICLAVASDIVRR